MALDRSVYGGTIFDVVPPVGAPIAMSEPMPIANFIVARRTPGGFLLASTDGNVLRLRDDLTSIHPSEPAAWSNRTFPS